jgi:hypothetical protein
MKTKLNHLFVLACTVLFLTTNTCGEAFPLSVSRLSDALTDIKENAESQALVRDAGKVASKNAMREMSTLLEKLSRTERSLYIQLKPALVNGREALVRKDLDLNLLDSEGRTNLQRMQQGYAPIGRDGQSINLHHIGQEADGFLAELTASDHQKLSSVLHDNMIDSAIDRNAFKQERAAYWKERARQILTGRNF